MYVLFSKSTTGSWEGCFTDWKRAKDWQKNSEEIKKKIESGEVETPAIKRKSILNRPAPVKIEHYIEKPENTQIYAKYGARSL